jgi:dTDP-4-amino-4,6-dideoxygalactose transaminase
MVTTNNTGLAEKMAQLRNHGARISEEERHNGPQPYILPDFNLLGFNYRMTDLQGAVGLVQLQKLDQFISERNEWAAYYTDKLSDISWLGLPETPKEFIHGWQSYVCWIDEEKSPASRNEIMKKLFEKGISVRPGTHAIHTLSYYRDRFGFVDNQFPVSQSAQSFSMAIPLHNRMNQDDYDYVISVLREI